MQQSNNQTILTPYFLLLVLCYLCSCQTTKRTKESGTKELNISSLQTDFDKGRYCDLLPLIDNYLNTIPQHTTAWHSAKIIAVKTYLELEQWEKASKAIDLLENSSQEATTLIEFQRDLLKARLLEQTNNIPAIEQAYQQLTNKLQKTSHYPALLAETHAYHGIFKNNLGNFETAEAQLTRIDKTQLKPSLIAKVYNNLAFLCSEKSRATESEQYSLQALHILKDKELAQHPYYALCLNDYAILNLYKGKMAVMDSLLAQAAQLNQACPIPSTTGFIYSNKANMSYNLGALPIAKQTYQKALQLFQEIPLTQEASKSAFKLAEVYFAMDSLAQAAAAYELALTLHQQVLGDKEHIQKARILQGMGGLEVYNWNYERADSLYELAAQIAANTFGKECSDYATVLNNLASSKEAQADNELALSLYQQTAHLDTLLFGQAHPNYKTTLFNIARCYTKMGKDAAALTYYQAAIKLQLQLLGDYFGGFSEDTRLDYLLEAMLHFDVFNTYACFKEDTALHKLVQNLNLATKNRVLDFSIQTQQLQLADQPKKVKDLYQQWKQQKELLTKFSLQPTEERAMAKSAIDSLKQSAKNLEIQLTRLANLQLTEDAIPTFEHIRAQLADKEAAIDFFNFFVADEYGQFPDSIFYFALITRPEWTAPKLVQLLEDSALKEILGLSSHYSLNAEVNHYLYQKIWAPLEPYLEGISTIHLSAEGYLHQVSFAGLFPNPDTDQSLLEQYKFYYYNNLKDIKRTSNTTTTSPKLLVVANPDYNAGLQSVEMENSEYFLPLPGTKLEVKFLQAYSQRYEIPMVLHQAAEASESAFRESITTFKPTLLHLATHGFFKLKDTTNYAVKTLGNRIKQADKSLLRSGLVFSGVNQHWTSTQPVVSTKDGVVTALEVANLELSEIDLVVLSACNTGRGGLVYSEGLFGLQRAFKLAGVKYTLVSLWAIPDQQTAELMTYFYDYLTNTNSPKQALYLAQKEMQKKYTSPFDWAGFVLLE